MARSTGLHAIEVQRMVGQKNHSMLNVITQARL